jgi:hypothetical protein
MKKKFEYIVITVIIVGLMLFFYFFIYLESMYNGVNAMQLPEQPSVYINISEEQLNQYPPFRQALLNPGRTVDVSEQQWQKISDFLRSQPTWDVYYSGKYYRIALITT